MITEVASDYCSKSVEGMQKPPLITLATDFGVQSQGIAMMHGVIYEICPQARVLDLMHGLPSFDLIVAARVMETVSSLPKGFHVCVVDPDVGTKRKGIAIETSRGDFLFGPDNGVLLPATRFLSGTKRVVELINKKYMRLPVSPVFHGRDVFAPAAAHLANGVGLEEFGPLLNANELTKAPYEEARLKDGIVHAKVININKFGSIHLNITHDAADRFGLKQGSGYEVLIGGRKTTIHFHTTFGDVVRGNEVVFKDDYGRIEIALNMQSFAKKYGVRVGEEIMIMV